MTTLLSPLLPRRPDPNLSGECATIFQALVARIHLDRPLARRLGWRGVRPSATHTPAWTFRTAGVRGVYGIVFEGERLVRQSDGDALEGYFSVSFFPDEDNPSLAAFSPEARATALSETFETLVRDLSAFAPRLTDFVFGLLTLRVALSGEALSLTLDASLNERIDTEAGEVVTHQKLLRLLQPGFALLVESARAVLPGPSRLSFVGYRVPALQIVSGECRENPRRTELRARETLAFGPCAEKSEDLTVRDVPLRHRPTRREGRRPVVHVVSGFLGAGKTTFLAQWLSFLHGRERFTGVLQNEFGEVDLDSLVLSGETKVESLDDGCVCCSLADSLRPGLLRLMETTPAEQFVLETTGVASPSYVMASLHLLDELVTPGLLITVVDALDLSQHPGNLREAGCRRDQIEAADLIVLNKCDCLDEKALAFVRALVARCNPKAPLYTADHGSIPFGEIDRFFLSLSDDALEDHPTLSGGGFFSQLNPAAARPFRRLAAQNEGFSTRTIPLPDPIDLATLRTSLEEAGPALLRAKGVVRLRRSPGEAPQDVVVQWAAGRLDCLAADEKTLAAPERALVLIGRPVPDHLSLEEALS